MCMERGYLLCFYSVLAAFASGSIKTVVSMIVIDLGRWVKARIARPTILELAALLLFLVFLGIAVWALR